MVEEWIGVRYIWSGSAPFTSDRLVRYVMAAATPRKRDGKVPHASKAGNAKSKAAGKKGAAKAKRQGHNKPGRTDNR